MADKKTKYIAPEQQTDHKKRQEDSETSIDK